MLGVATAKLPGSSMAEGITADLEDNVCGADYLGDVRKFVKK
jgi:hypothetical protein